MPSTLTNYRVFIASPSGLDAEREAFSEILNEYNLSEANPRGIQFQPIGWEITVTGKGRPQELINGLVRNSDFFVLLLHDRWGSSPFASGDVAANYSSGTEEEFNIALECLENPEHHMAEIVLVFKSVDERQLADPGPQLKSVLEFRQEREEKKDFLFSLIDSVRAFRSEIRRHLGDWSRRHENGDDPGPSEVRRIATKFYVGEHKTFGASQNLREEQLLAKAEHLAEDGQTLEAELAFSKLVVNEPSPIALARYGRFLRKSGQLERAESILEDAILSSDRTNDVHAKAYAIRQNARIYEKKRKFREAAREYIRAMVLFEELGDIEGQARTLRDISSVNRLSGDLDSAAQYLDEAMELYKTIELNDGIASVWGHKGLVHSARGDFLSALEAHEAALKLHADGENGRAIAIIQGNLGVVNRALELFEESLGMHLSALKYFKSAQEASGILRELTNCGVTYRKLGRLDEAVNSHNEALDLARQKKESRHVAIQFANLGSVYRDQNRYDDAEKFYKKALEIGERESDIKSISIQHENIGTLYRLTKRFMESEEHFRIALDGYGQLGMNFGIANSQKELGMLLCESDQISRGIPHLEEAKALFNHSDMQTRVQEIDLIIEKYQK